MKNVSVTGVLVADQWDPDGIITELALLTDDEGKYVICPDDIGENIATILRKKIQVNGLLNTNGREQKISVIDYHPVPYW